MQRAVRQRGGQFVEQQTEAAAAIADALAPQQVDRLDLVAALVDHGDAGIAQGLLDAVVAHVAVAAP